MRKMLLSLSLLLAGWSAMNAAEKAGITKKAYGTMPDGTAVDEYTLTNDKGAILKVITLGGIVTELHVPDKEGKLADVSLGCSNLAEYREGHPYFGAIVGRVGNRIAKGKFTLDGKEYTLATNNGPNHLHGGKIGFDKVVWKAEPSSTAEGQKLKLTYTSKDGEEGYPGTVENTVVYTWTNDNKWIIDYSLTADKKTPVNVTQHCYFNLAGHNAGDILGHEMKLDADQYIPTDDTLIPVGKIDAVKGTPFDFTEGKAIGKDIKQIKADPIGYDLCYVVRDGKGLRSVATVTDPKSGRVMKVLSTEPGVQFYSGNFLDGKQKGKNGTLYKQYSGFCLETMHYPDSVNQPTFPSTILEPGKTYTSQTVYEFSAK
jgi:aldose 1-epimerase